MTKALADELERLEKRCAEIDAHYARYPDTPDRTAEQHAADIRAILSALREAGEPVAWRELEAAARDVIATMSSSFTARNGREVGIEADDGEKCWIVHSDQIEALRRALASPVQREVTRDRIASAIMVEPAFMNEVRDEQQSGLAELLADKLAALLSAAEGAQ